MTLELTIRFYPLLVIATFCLYMTLGIDKKVPASTRAGEIGGVAFAALIFPISLIAFILEKPWRN